MDGAEVLVAWLDLRVSEAADALGSLSREERERVARYSTPELRRRAHARFALRREVLGRVLGTPARDVELERDARGGLIAGAGAVVVSSSSSGDHCLLAVATRQVGVDVESVREVLDTQRFLEKVATPREAAVLASLAPSEQHDALARLWTRKEAYLKATGEGIGGGVTHVEVPLGAGLWEHAFEPVPGRAPWLLYDLACPSDELAAALVVASSEPTPSVVTWAAASA